MRKGFDISHWAGTINWAQVAYGKPDWLCFKASDGNWETGRYMENFDSRLLPNWDGAHRYVKSARKDTYHWLANGKDPNWQADLARFIHGLLDPKPITMWLDAEEKTKGGSWAGFRIVLDALVNPGIYTSPGWLAWADIAWGLRPAWLAQYPLWLAVYPKVVDLSKPPKAPKPWLKWEVWQVDKNHKLPGITSGISLDVIME